MMLRYSIAVVVGLLMMANTAFAQPAFNMTDTTFNACSGFFYDSGGPSGFSSGYQPNESYVWTVCPSSTSLMSFNFSQMNLDTTVGASGAQRLNWHEIIN